ASRTRRSTSCRSDSSGRLGVGVDQFGQFGAGGGVLGIVGEIGEFHGVAVDLETALPPKKL
ncbi:hypothetical protein, partial [Edaphobacter aggregans]|uniref:hypothetical protein n=1 Tax=Edaphobacter aggregans TaxID=570835 RepID=UPI001B80A54A